MRISSLLLGVVIVASPWANAAAESNPPRMATPPSAQLPANTALAAGELPLQAALKQLDSSNLNLIAARAHLNESRGVVEQAQSQLHPTLLAVGSYVRNNDEVALNVGQLLAALPGAPSVPNVVIQPLDAWTATGALRVPLFTPSAWYDVDAAKAVAGVGQANVEVSRRQLRATFATLAYTGSALEDVVAASQRAVELAAEQGLSAQRRVAVGTSAPLDVLRGQTEEVSRKSDLARAEADLARVRLALGALLGRDTPVRVVVPEMNIAPAERSERAELAALHARTVVAETQLRSAKARVLPQLSATATVFASNQPYPTGDKTGWRVGAELTIPLYDGGFRYGKRHEVEANLGALRAEEDAKRLGIRQEITDAEREIGVAHDRLSLAETRQGLARDAAASAKRSNDAGVATTLDVLDANDKLYKADVAMAEARARLAQAQIELERARGGQQ